jgi:hypothetical protein
MEKEVLYALIEKWEYKDSNKTVRGNDDSEDGRIDRAIDQESERTKRQCADDLRTLVKLLAK